MHLSELMIDICWLLLFVPRKRSSRNKTRLARQRQTIASSSTERSNSGHASATRSPSGQSTDRSKSGHSKNRSRSGNVLSRSPSGQHSADRTQSGRPRERSQGPAVPGSVTSHFPPPPTMSKSSPRFAKGTQLNATPPLSQRSSILGKSSLPGSGKGQGNANRMKDASGKKETRSVADKSSIGKTLENSGKNLLGRQGGKAVPGKKWRSQVKGQPSTGKKGPAEKGRKSDGGRRKDIKAYVTRTFSAAIEVCYPVYLHGVVDVWP